MGKPNTGKMMAVCRTREFGVELKKVPVPKAEPGHLVIKVLACAINPGDKAWIAGSLPGTPESLYKVCGVSGAGRVLEIGAGVHPKYKGKKVAFYRSLKFGDNIVGTWCEYARMHYLHCLILPDDVSCEDYSGSLVNGITPFVFLDQITEQGHQAVISTAGTSATGRALLGVCEARDIPLISLVRSEEGKQSLKELGSSHVLIQSDPDFDVQLEKLAEELKATAVFDGVGGDLVGRVAKVLPSGSTIYAYGFLGGNRPLDFPTMLLLIKSLTLTYFGIIFHPTVRDPEKLKKALEELQGLIWMPHFKTKVGKKFTLEEINAAMQFSSASGGKAVLCPFI